MTKKKTAPVSVRKEVAIMMNQHRIWHRIQKKINPFMGCTDQGSKGKLDVIMEKFARKYPSDVFIAGCDDDYFSTSSLYFILHRHKTKFMGTTVLFVSQCDNQVPTIFFLYPGHVQSVQAALKKCTKAYIGSDEWKMWRNVERLMKKKQQEGKP